MMMELTFDAATPRSKVTARDSKRRARTPCAPALVHPADRGPGIGQRMVARRGWHSANRLLRRTEAAFVVAVLASLLALGTLTFGYAVDGLVAVQAAGVPVVAVSE